MRKTKNRILAGVLAALMVLTTVPVNAIELGSSQDNYSGVYVEEPTAETSETSEAATEDNEYTGVYIETDDAQESTATPSNMPSESEDSSEIEDESVSESSSQETKDSDKYDGVYVEDNASKGDIQNEENTENISVEADANEYDASLNALYCTGMRPSLYSTWNPNWGNQPADSSNYYYILWNATAYVNRSGSFTFTYIPNFTGNIQSEYVGFKDLNGRYIIGSNTETRSLTQSTVSHSMAFITKVPKTQFDSLEEVEITLDMTINNGTVWQGSQPIETQTVSASYRKTTKPIEPVDYLRFADSKQFKINLFDYNAVDDTYAETVNQSKFNTLINRGHRLWFYPSGVTPATLSAPFTENTYSGGYNTPIGTQPSVYGNDLFAPAVIQGILRDRLDNDGFPILANGNESLKYLFDPDTPEQNRTTYRNVENLFYRVGNTRKVMFDSNDFYAYYDRGNNAFTLYNPNEYGLTSQGFFPFNEYDSSKGDVFFQDNFNHHFGMGIETNFYIPQDGLMLDESEEYFSFSGDDDMWVFIDGKLVLDMGGIHSPMKGTINFATGEITLDKYTWPENNVGRPEQEYYNGLAMDSDCIYPAYVRVGQTEQDKLNQRAEDNLVVGNLADILGENYKEGSIENHTMQIFYLERGGVYSNLRMEFNLEFNNELSLTKEVNTTNKASYKDIDHLFKVYLENIENGHGTNEYSLMTLETMEAENIDIVTYDSDEEEIETKFRDNTIYLKDGQTAKVYGINNQRKYYVEEIGVDKTVYYRTTAETTKANGAIDVINLTETEDNSGVVYATEATTINQIDNIKYINSVGTNVSVEKIWQDSDGNEINPPETSVTVNLLRRIEGDEFKPVDKVVLNDDNGWKYTFNGLPKSDGEGNTYEYTVTEDTVEGYDTFIKLITSDAPVNTDTAETTYESIGEYWVPIPHDDSYELDPSEEYMIMLTGQHDALTLDFGRYGQYGDNGQGSFLKTDTLPVITKKAYDAERNEYSKMISTGFSNEDLYTWTWNNSFRNSRLPGRLMLVGGMQSQWAGFRYYIDGWSGWNGDFDIWNGGTTGYMYSDVTWAYVSNSLELAYSSQAAQYFDLWHKVELFESHETIIAESDTVSYLITNKEQSPQTSGIKFKKFIQGTDEAWEQLNLDKNDTYNFPITMRNVETGDLIKGVLTNKNELSFANVPLGTYMVTEADDNYFDFVSMVGETEVEGIAFDGTTLVIGEGIPDNAVYTIDVTNELEPIRYYEGKAEKQNYLAGPESSISADTIVLATLAVYDKQTEEAAKAQIDTIIVEFKQSGVDDFYDFLLENEWFTSTSARLDALSEDEQTKFLTDNEDTIKKVYDYLRTQPL